ncbi:MAG: cupin domain-containing protein [Deltaproteobacteria bacterium HGW-Deltaproteobacteria-6]|jgi:quercetin dioxygenase-like cupin family protein|nr:MAG: cupin domain-containing protein [Deltaproteobacteria bacterium HGW-Deltaproteobacteria-6]
MKTIHYTSVEPRHFDNDQAKGVSGRVVIGRDDDANHFCMRVFEVAPGGHTPRHAHAWEHEIFIHAGKGEVYGRGKWHPLQAGSVIFVPADEDHQIRNTDREILIFACLIPSGVPEL